eukprot:11781133-Alexandrium_andersonii.AAC.1
MALTRPARRSKASIGRSLSSAGDQPSGPADVLGPARAIPQRLLPVCAGRPISAPAGKALSPRLSASCAKTFCQASRTISSMRTGSQ